MDKKCKNIIMGKCVMKSLCLCAVFLLFASISFAQEPIREKLTLNNPKEKDICTAVKKTIKDGLNTKDTVKTGIQLGYSACLIIKCAIMAEGNLKDIVYGAIEGGTPPEVVARCATDAGAEPKDVAQCISSAGSPGLCYVQPEKLETMEIWVPGGNPGGGYLSPHIP
jgi:hypothetical protein